MHWPLANRLEQAWTGVEESDRALVSKIVGQSMDRYLIMVRPLRYNIWEAKATL